MDKRKIQFKTRSGKTITFLVRKREKKSKEKQERRYTVKELRTIEDYLCSKMTFNDFNKYFNDSKRSHWGYFENLLNWIEDHPYKAEWVIYKHRR